MKKHVFGILFIVLSAFTHVVHAAETRAFTASDYKAAQAAETPVVIHVRASWCMICKKQVGVLDELMTQPEFSDYTLFIIDFSTQKELATSFGVSRQSTFIVSKGEEELGRSVGQTSRDQIRELLLKAAS